jgi:hypothetical protein
LCPLLFALAIYLNQFVLTRPVMASHARPSTHFEIVISVTNLLAWCRSSYFRN